MSLPKIDLVEIKIKEEKGKKKMKTENVYFSNINMNIEFHIGKSAQDNVDIIDIAHPNDIWFHVKNDSSCHVVAILPEKVNKKELHTIVKKGALKYEESCFNKHPH